MALTKSHFWFTTAPTHVADGTGRWRSRSGENGREWRERDLGNGKVERVYLDTDAANLVKYRNAL